MGRTVKEGAEAARDAGYEIAELVFQKQNAYGDASGIQHQIWKALLAQYIVSNRELRALPWHRLKEFEKTEQDYYMFPVALMDHIPRLTRVFDRICRIVSNPAQDRMGEDPWRDLAGDAICGIVMPRTKPDNPQPNAAPEPPEVEMTISLPDSDFSFRGRIRRAGSTEFISANELFHDPADGVIYGRRGVEPSTATADVGPMGDDPHEDPAPAHTRVWNEEPVRPGYVRVPRNPVANPEPEDIARQEEYTQRRADRAAADAKLAQRRHERDARYYEE